MKKQYSDLTPFLLDTFDYDQETELFTIYQEFQTQIDVKLRIRYYLMAYLRRMELTKQLPTFNEIVLNITPLLKNGIAPENQIILSVLENIADRVGNKERWRLK